MGRLRVGLVGTGLIATTKHLPAMRNLGSQVEIVGICDLNLEQAKKLASEFGVPNVYTDLSELLDKQHPGIVDICTPPKSHAAIALQCLEAGANILIEKPMCQTIEECDEVIALAGKVGRQICIAHSDLFYPSFTKARQIINNGEIGTFRGMHIHLSTPTDYITSKPDHWAHKLPGGVFGETGPHVVYMTLAFINPILDAHVIGRKLLDECPWSPYEDYRVSLVGEKATCTATMVYATKQWAGTVDLWGTDGSLRIDLQSQCLVHSRREGLRAIPVGISTIGEMAQVATSAASTALSYLCGRRTQTHQELLKAFCTSIEQGTASPVPADEGRETIRVMSLLSEQLDGAA